MSAPVNIDPNLPADLYPVNAAQLAEEMEQVTVSQTLAWVSPLTIILGVRNWGTSQALPVLILKDDTGEAVSLIALPGGAT